VATHLGLENFFATEKLRAKEIASQLPLDGLHGAMKIQNWKWGQWQKHLNSCLFLASLFMPPFILA